MILYVKIMNMKKNIIKSFSTYIGENLREDHWQNLIPRLDARMADYLKTLIQEYTISSHLVTYIPPCGARSEGLHYQIVIILN